MTSPGRLLYYNFRLLHKISKWLRRRLSPAGFLILGAMVTSGIFGIDTRGSLAYQVFSITLSFLLIAWLSTLVFRGKFKIRRELPEFGTATVPVNYRVTISNLDRFVHRDLMFQDELFTEFPAYEAFRRARDPEDRQRNWIDRKIGYPRLMSLLQKNRGGSLSWLNLERVPARDEADLRIEFTPMRRGFLHFDASLIARPDPFGLVRAIKTRKNPEKLLILPKTYKVPRIHLPGRRKYQQGGINQASLVGDSQEFMSLRDYQPGDPLRSIHWRSYAKRSEPVVKEYRDEFFVRHGLVLDTFLEGNAEIQFEEAVSLAASFASNIEEQDALLDLMFVGTDSYRFTTGRSFGKSANMLEILACVTPGDDRDFQRLVDLVGRHAGELSGLITVLLDWDEKRRDLVKALVARKIPVIVFVIQDVNSGSITPGPLETTPEWFIPLTVDRIQESLDQVDWSTIE